MHDTFASRLAGAAPLASYRDATPDASSLKATAGAPYRNVTLSLSKGEPQAVAAAILFREILKPLAEGLGPVGEIALGAVADELFVRSRR
jgi:hypothetical protein